MHPDQGLTTLNLKVNHGERFGQELIVHTKECLPKNFLSGDL